LQASCIAPEQVEEGVPLSGIRAYEPDWLSCDFWPIVSIEGAERRWDRNRAGEGTGRAGCEGDPQRHSASVFSGGEDPHCSSGLRGEDSIAELCRREGIVQNLYYRWSKEFLGAAKKRLAGDTEN
jgi:hypothetical protein